MATFQGDHTSLAMKKLIALALLAAGLGVTAIGFNSGSTGWIVGGVLIIAAAAILLIAKIVRRNP